MNIGFILDFQGLRASGNLRFYGLVNVYIGLGWVWRPPLYIILRPEKTQVTTRPKTLEIKNKADIHVSLAKLYLAITFFFL